MYIIFFVVAVLESERSHEMLFPHPFFVCSAVGQLSSVCSLRPAAGGALNGLPHCESLGGCRVGGVEHRGLHL